MGIEECLPNIAFMISQQKYNTNPLANIPTEDLIAELERRGCFANDIRNIMQDLQNIGDTNG